MSLTRFVAGIVIVLCLLVITDPAFAARRELVLHTFPIGSSDGFWPRANLIFDDAGNLYGATT